MQEFKTKQVLLPNLLSKCQSPHKRDAKLELSSIDMVVTPLHERLQALADGYLKKYGDSALGQDDECITAVSLQVTLPQLTTPESVFSGHTDKLQITPINHSHLYQIGSITKSFISVILLQIEADPENDFSINDKIIKYLPQYPQWGDITVKQLLNMTSGIPCYSADINFRKDFFKGPTRYWAPEKLIDYIAKQSLRFPAGDGYNYSNTNYILAGLIISKITAYTVEEEIQLRFLQKGNSSRVSLENTHYVSDKYPKMLVARQVSGYMCKSDYYPYIPPKTDVTSYSLSYMGPAGAMVSDLADVAHWVRALFTSTNLLPDTQRKKLISCVSVKTGEPIKTPSEKEKMIFGLGVIQTLFNDKVFWSYPGETYGGRAIYAYFPKENMVITVMVNSMAKSHITELVKEVYTVVTSFYHPEKLDVEKADPKLEKKISMPLPTRSKSAAVVNQSVAAGTTLEQQKSPACNSMFHKRELTKLTEEQHERMLGRKLGVTITEDEMADSAFGQGSNVARVMR